jgi:hypothetical protein
MADTKQFGNPYNMPPYFKLWFGGDYIPKDWDRNKVWFRGGFIGSINVERSHYWRHDDEDTDIVGYVSTDREFNLSHEEQYIVEQIAKESFVSHFVNGCVGVDKNVPIEKYRSSWPLGEVSYLNAANLRKAALDSYMAIRDHLSFMAWRAGRSTPFHT